MKAISSILSLSISALLAGSAVAQTFQGPSTGSTPYVLPTIPGWEAISVFTTDNTGANPDDTVPNLVGGAPYGMAGIPDGEGAYDNGNGTFTLLLNHELSTPTGVARAHGGSSAYVSKWIINKNNLQVQGGTDLMTSVYGWSTANQASNAAPSSAVSFSRFCSADLPEVSAYYNAASGLGTQERIFMHGEEGSATGWQQGTVATGANAGKSYTLGKLNLTTNGSGLTGVGAWENTLANPFAQDLTVVMGNSDGGTNLMNNSVSCYVGTKQSTGTEVEKAGLMNGTLKFIAVTGFADNSGSTTEEFTNATTRANVIPNGTRFTLSGTTATTFSRPEDGAWNPLNLNQYYFVTTDRLDQVSDNLGGQIGQTRLWRLTFDTITNPAAGGVIECLIDGQTVAGQKVNMFDNMTVNRKTGHLLLQEDVGGAAHNGKMWEYDPSIFTGATNSGALVMIAKHDPARFGDVGLAPTLPFNNDEETSGVIEITSIMAGSTLHKGNTGEAWYMSSDQAHYTTGVTAAQVEGGQYFVMHQLGLSANRGVLARNRRTGTFDETDSVSNYTSFPIVGPVYLVLDNLPPGVTLANAAGTTANNAPLGSPYVTVSAGALAQGATSAATTLQFNNPGNVQITYNARVLNGIAP